MLGDSWAQSAWLIEARRVCLGPSVTERRVLALAQTPGVRAAVTAYQVQQNWFTLTAGVPPHPSGSLETVTGVLGLMHHPLSGEGGLHLD